MKTYSTFDLNLSATLITMGYKLIELDKANIKKVKFYFLYEKGIEQSVMDFWDNKITLPARTLFDNQKTCKNRIYTDA